MTKNSISLIVLIALIIAGCKNDYNNKIRTFSFKEDTINYPPGQLSNLDIKFGFKNLKLETKLEDYNFGPEWIKIIGADRFTFYNNTQPRTSIGDLQIEKILLTFYKNKLISIDIGLQPETVGSVITLEHFASGQRLAVLLIELFGQPNDLSFTFCSHTTKIILAGSQNIYINDKELITENPYFLYKLNADSVGKDIYSYELTGARWKGKKTILEYSSMQKKGNNIRSQFRFNIIDYDIIYLEYLTALDDGKRKQKDVEQHNINKRIADSISQEQEKVKSRVKGL